MSHKQMRILICGGSGFMGSHFIRHLYKKYPRYLITNFDLLTYAGNPDNLKDIDGKEKKLGNKKRYTFVKGDICDERAVHKLLSATSYDVVINFAAESHVDRSILDAFQFIRTNVHGAFVLLEAARIHKIPRFIYISTDEVYGDIAMGESSAENYPLQPTNPYAASKASADLLAQSYMKTHKLPILIIRSSNNYGSHQYPEKLHPLVITNLLEGRPIPLHGEGQHRRSWLHVEDFCEAVDLIMHRGQEYEIYNIAGEEKTNLDVIETIAKILDKNPRDYIKYVTDRPGPDFRYSPDDKKIKKLLGWTPLKAYKTVMESLVQWYLKNQSWWKKIRNKSDFLDHYKLQSQGYEHHLKTEHASRRF